MEITNTLIIVAIISSALFFVYLLYKRQKLLKVQLGKTILKLNKINDLPGIYAILNAVIQQNVRFKIKLNNRGKSFNSSLLKIDSSSLFIDALFPYEGSDLIQDSHFISIEFTIDEADHIPFVFNAIFLSKEMYKGYSAIAISIPKTIEKDQKRSYHRVTPLVSDPVYLKCALNGTNINEKVANISGGGVAFYTNHGKSVLWPGRIIDTATVTLPDSFVIITIAIINKLTQTEYPVLINGTPYHYYCGAEFVEMDEKTRSIIIKYVIEKERAELKRMNRTYE